MARRAGKGQSTPAQTSTRPGLDDLLPEETRKRIATKIAMKSQQDIDRILARLDAEMPEAQKEMDALLARLRTTRIVEAA
jgi:ABC-type phosphate transport system auxiliary subunit